MTHYRDMDIITAIANGYQETGYIPEDAKYTAINADKDIKVCKVCDRVYEVFSHANRISCDYYYNFPKYKKGKCTCPYCRMSQNKKTFYMWDRGKRKEISFDKFIKNNYGKK